MNCLDVNATERGRNIGVSAEPLIRSNRDKMKELCRAAGSYAAAADLISRQTQRPLSVDSIKAWTCDPLKKRARPCPDWAIKALERYLRRRPMRTNV